MARGKKPFKVSWLKIRDRTSVSQELLLIPTVQSLDNPTRADHPVATNRVVLGLSVVFVTVVTVVRLLTRHSMMRKENVKRSTSKKMRTGQEAGNQPCEYQAVTQRTISHPRISEIPRLKWGDNFVCTGNGTFLLVQKCRVSLFILSFPRGSLLSLSY